MGNDVIVFRKEEIYITEDNISEENSVREYNKQYDEYKTADPRDNSDGGIEDLEDDEVVRTPTDNNED